MSRGYSREGWLAAPDRRGHGQYFDRARSGSHPCVPGEGSGAIGCQAHPQGGCWRRPTPKTACGWCCWPTSIFWPILPLPGLLRRKGSGFTAVNSLSAPRRFPIRRGAVCHLPAPGVGDEGREITFRTLDVGGDKMLRITTIPGRRTPFWACVRSGSRSRTTTFLSIRCGRSCGRVLTRISVSCFPMVSSVG